MNPTEEKGQSYTAREQELIQQLVQARLEQKSELGYEDLDSYELPPRTQFSMLNKPALTFKHRQMTFNMAAVRLFKGVQYILPFTSSSKKRVAVVTCTEEESESVEWARYNAKGAWVNKTITSDEYVSKIFKLMNWDPNGRYKVMGRVANSERGLILVFDLTEAILFTAPEEYVDKKTGEVKKRQIKYYPDEYKDRIGKTYRDYVEKYQMSFFEPLSGYGEEESPPSSTQEATPQVSVGIEEGHHE